MLTLHVIQAAFGDCLLLEAGTARDKHYILIDGGPPNTYESHLKPTLEDLAKAGDSLDLVVLSHVDNDHIIGLLDFFAELRASKDTGGEPLIRVDALWHNSFSDTVDPDDVIAPRLAAVASTANMSVMSSTGIAVLGVNEGRSLRVAATALGVPMNPKFAKNIITADTATAPRKVGPLTITVVGPTAKNLEALRKEWIAWLDKHEDSLSDPAVAAAADRSVPNLSSIVLLVEAGKKRLLLTGDARGDHIVQGLEQAGKLSDGGMHVDVLKLPHHGSERNITRTFFESITADTYVVSADGRYDNPDLNTLLWIVDVAEEQGRAITIVATNAPKPVADLKKKRPPAKHGYTLTVLDGGDHSIPVSL